MRKKTSAFLTTLAACLLGPVAQAAEHPLDVVLLLDMQPQQRAGDRLFVTDMSGTPRVNRQLYPARLNACLLRNVTVPSDLKNVTEESWGYAQLARRLTQGKRTDLLDIQGTYASAGAPDADKALQRLVQAWLRAQGATAGLELARCGGTPTLPNSLGYSNYENNDLHEELVAIPRVLLPYVQDLPRYAKATAGDYSKTMLFSFDELLGPAQTLSAAKQAQVDLDSRYAQLAASDDRSQVAALVRAAGALPRSGGELDYCATAAMDAALILGYRSLGLDMLPALLNEQISDSRNRIRFAGNTAYDSVNDIFIAITSQRKPCQVVLGTAKEVVDLRAALAAQGRGAQSALYGALLPLDDARDRYARSLDQGYENYGQLAFARTIGAGTAALKQLRTYGVQSLADYNREAAAMQDSGHTAETSATAVLNFLQDRKDAQGNGRSTLAQRDARLAQLRREREQLEQARRERRAAYEQQFPYEAVLSCSTGQQHQSLLPCFMADGLNSHLEITSGTAYVLYQPWEFARLGAETPGEGLVIPLRAAFEITAQNIGERMVLRAMVRETATGRTVYEKGAARFGVIRISRE
jgi:hypothetical protein